MPSSKLKSPDRYPAHWHSCLSWLAACDKLPQEIEITVHTMKCNLETQRRKAAALRESIKLYPAWNWEVRQMVEKGELFFEVRRGRELWAIRKQQPTVMEILRNAGVA